jgi:hypothetical protein
MKLKSWRCPKVERRGGGIHGLGLFATADIKKGEVVAYKAGKIVNKEYVEKHKDLLKGSHAQLDDNLFLAPTNEEEWDDTLIGVNHSCAPNVYINGQITVVTMRDVRSGEELVYDVSTDTDSDTHIIEKCLCKSNGCRGYINPPQDWQNKEFQELRAGYFSSHLQKKIDIVNN